MLLRKERVPAKRMTLWRLVCSECGPLEPPMRSKTMLDQEARDHAGNEHDGDRVSLV